MDIKFRKMTKKDHPVIKELISEAWFKEYTFKRSTIKQYENAYLYMYLADSNYNMVATHNNKVIGFLFANIKKVNFFKRAYYNTRLFFLALRMLLTKNGRRGIKIGLKTKKTNRSLVKTHKKELDCELSLFIIKEEYRNKKIGSKLENSLYEHLKQNNFRNYFVFTDTYSNYLYYEHKGYRRLNETFVDFDVDDDDPGSTYYLYVKDIK